MKRNRSLQKKEKLAIAKEKKNPDGNNTSSIIVVEDVNTTTHGKSLEPWLSFKLAHLTTADRDLIASGDELTNKHIVLLTLS